MKEGMAIFIYFFQHIMTVKYFSFSFVLGQSWGVRIVIGNIKARIFGLSYCFYQMVVILFHSVPSVLLFCSVIALNVLIYWCCNVFPSKVNLGTKQATVK